MAAKYQLVVQFDDESGEALDKVIALEDELIEMLDGVAEVDGHDVGSGTAYIMIETAKPKKVWEMIEPLVEKAEEERQLSPLAAAYREEDEDDYTVIWPTDYEGEFEVA